MEEEQTQGGQPATNEPGPVPYERFKEVNERLKVYEAAATKAEVEKKEAEEKRLAEEKNWRELAEKKDAELKAERAEREREMKARKRLEIASKKGLPVELADRLRGDTDEDLEKDADVLLTLGVNKPENTPGVPPPSRSGKAPSVDYATMTPAQIREHRAKLAGK